MIFIDKLIILIFY